MYWCGGRGGVWDVVCVCGVGFGRMEGVGGGWGFVVGLLILVLVKFCVGNCYWGLLK